MPAWVIVLILIVTIWPPVSFVAGVLLGTAMKNADRRPGGK